MENQDVTSPVADENTSVTEVTQDQGFDDSADINEQNADDEDDQDLDGDQGEEDADDAEEVDFEGQKYRVPKVLKDALLRQADYTRKTQEVAEHRKAIEADRQRLQNDGRQLQENLVAVGELGALNRTVQDFETYDWQAYIQQDPIRAQQDWIAYQQVKEQRQSVLSRLQETIQAQTLEEQRASAKALEEGRAVLAKEIPGYGAEMEGKLADFAAQFQFSRDDVLQAVADPRQIKILRLAQIGFEAERAKAAVKKIQASQQVKPVPRVSGNAPAARDPRRMTTEEWMAHRTSELAKRSKR